MNLDDILDHARTAIDNPDDAAVASFADRLLEVFDDPGAPSDTREIVECFNMWVNGGTEWVYQEDFDRVGGATLPYHPLGPHPKRYCTDGLLLVPTTHWIDDRGKEAADKNEPDWEIFAFFQHKEDQQRKGADAAKWQRRRRNNKPGFTDRTKEKDYCSLWDPSGTWHLTTRELVDRMHNWGGMWQVIVIVIAARVFAPERFPHNTYTFRGQ